MKATNPKVSWGKLCDLFGISRQAYYQRLNQEIKTAFEAEIVLKEVKELRKDQRRVGTRKLYIHLQDVLRQHGIKMGRDALFDLLREHGLLVRQRKRRIKTTDSNHPWRKYPNLIKSFEPNGANQLWVCDITYLYTDEGFVYLFLITDAYSHKVVGYHTSFNMEATSALAALRMALNQLEEGQTPFHHSDRGSQYCSDIYTALLKKNSLPISMTENGDPWENAVAERINGILKNDLLPEKISTKSEAVDLVHYFVRVYNSIRLHSSVENLTPDEAHERTGELCRLWKKERSEKSESVPVDANLSSPESFSKGQALRVLS
ncbi:MAG: transposase [Saprospiraceae bacterium]|nr:MAG: transposase [Saprospiraceae bacterium]